MRTPTSGTAYELSAHGYDLAVASVGASLRSLRTRDRDLVAPFAADEIRPALRGAVLAPWPNRLADGRYTFAGVTHRLPLTEPETGNAAHGLAAWLDFGLVEQGDEHLVLSARIEPQPGYPWRIRLDVRFELGPDGFRQRVSATNESGDSAPIGLGVHPYVLAGCSGEAALDDWTLRCGARRVLLVSDDRLLPVDEVDVASYDGGALDFAEARAIGDTVLNHAFTDFASNGTGVEVVTVTAPDGHGVEVSWPSSAAWVQLYTADHQEGAERRAALAVEPMTCPPDAFNSGRNLRVLRSGETTALEWRLRAL